MLEIFARRSARWRGQSQRVSIHGPPGGQRRLGGRQPRDRNPERGAAHVVHAQPVAEGHRRRLAAVLAADPQLEIGPGAAAQLARHLDQLADAGLVQHLERVVLDDAVLEVVGQEVARVVAATGPRWSG